MTLLFIILVLATANS